MHDAEAAKKLIGLLDLTSLNENDNVSKIEKLCKKATTPHGNVAAVCVYSKFITLAKEILKGTDIKIATVVNFPQGDSEIKAVREEIQKAIKLGADEIDAVLPYKKFINGDKAYCKDFINMVIEECKDKAVTKIILETGELKETSLIVSATEMCLEAGINFIKTSTGKAEISATPEVANIILETIKKSGKEAGFKASGGIKITYDAKKYLILSNAIFGEKWATSKHLRIGASSLLDELLATIERGY